MARRYERIIGGRFSIPDRSGDYRANAAPSAEFATEPGRKTPTVKGTDSAGAIVTTPPMVQIKFALKAK